MDSNLPLKAKVWAEGHEKGLAGEEPDCPFALESEEGTAWLEGYVDAIELKCEADRLLRRG